MAQADNLLNTEYRISHTTGTVWIKQSKGKLNYDDNVSE